MPIIRPVSIGRSRVQAHNAPATKTTATRSQLTRPVSNRAGESAKAAASQGRRGVTPASSHAASSVSTANPSALTITKIRISRCTSGRPPSSLAGRSLREVRSGDPFSQCVTWAAPQAQ